MKIYQVNFLLNVKNLIRSNENKVFNKLIYNILIKWFTFTNQFLINTS